MPKLNQDYHQGIRLPWDFSLWAGLTVGGPSDAELNTEGTLFRSAVVDWPKQG